MFLEEISTAMKESHAPHPLAKWIEQHSTPADFARDVGCTRSHISNIILGHKRPSLDLLARIEKRTRGRVGLSAFRTLEAAE